MGKADQELHEFIMSRMLDRALLIEAAPDLYDAAKKALGLLRLIQATARPDSDETLDATIDALDAALRKARGQS